MKDRYLDRLNPIFLQITFLSHLGVDENRTVVEMDLAMLPIFKKGIKAVDKRLVSLTRQSNNHLRISRHSCFHIACLQFIK